MRTTGIRALARKGQSAVAAALFVCVSSAASAQADWAFVDATQAAHLRIEHGFTLGFSGEPDMMGGGAAAADLDGDGDHDLVVVTGDLSAPRLLRNRGDGVFDDVTAGSGLVAAGIYNGVSIADLDGDGYPDLIFGGLGGQGVRVWRGLGGMRFDDISVVSGIDISDDTWSAALADYDGDGVLDLALGRWARGAGRGGHLWRGLGGGRFASAETDLGIATELAQRAYTFTPNFGDLDGDGRPDLVWAADFGNSRVLLNRAGRFVNATTATIDDENGMGSALADYDNDGDLDWFVSSIWDPDGVAFGNWGVSGNRLYRNRGDGHFDDVSAAVGVRQGWWGWASCFADFNNDGQLDLVHVNGMSAAPATEFHADPTRLFIADGQGGFSEQSLQRGLVDSGQGRAMVCFDADGDGDIDLFIQNNSGYSRFFRNTLDGAAHWLTVRLHDISSNRAAIGARVRLRAGGVTQTREIQAGANYLSSDPSEAHFGLGAGATVESLQLRWPDGGEQTVAVAAVDRVIDIVRGQPPAPPLALQVPIDAATLILLALLLCSAGLLSLRGARRFY